MVLVQEALQEKRVAEIAGQIASRPDVKFIPVSYTHLQYEEAVNEMLLRTSTPNAPWIVVEGNCKYYARIKVLETVCDAIEARIREKDGTGK